MSDTDREAKRGIRKGLEIFFSVLFFLLSILSLDIYDREEQERIAR